MYKIEILARLNAYLGMTSCHFWGWFPHNHYQCSTSTSKISTLLYWQRGTIPQSPPWKGDELTNYSMPACLNNLMWSVLFIDSWYDLYQCCLSLTRFSPDKPRIRRCLLRCYDLSAKSKPRLIYVKSAKQISALIVVRVGFFLWSGLCRKEVFLTLFAKLTDFANQEVSIGNSSNPCTFGENPLRIGWIYTFALVENYDIPT